MFNREAFNREVLSLPMYLRASISTGVKTMSIASQLDSVVEAIYVMKEIKGYPYKEISDLLRKHGLKAATPSNINQWYTSRQKTIDLLSECAINWRNGKLVLDGTTIPSLPEEVAVVSGKAKEQMSEDSTGKATIMKSNSDVPSFVSGIAGSNAEPKHPAQELDGEGTVEVDENLVLDWGVFLRSCRAKYGVNSSEVSAELVNRGIITEDKELARKSDYFPETEPFVKLDWIRVKVKATLALLLFG